MQYTKIQLEQKILSILPYLDMTAILINGPWPFEQIFNSL